MGWNGQAADYLAALLWWWRSAHAGGADGFAYLAEYYNSTPNRHIDEYTNDRRRAIEFYRRAALIGHAGAIEYVAHYDKTS
jgi:TPR repeat protein